MTYWNIFFNYWDLATEDDGFWKMETLATERSADLCHFSSGDHMAGAGIGFGANCRAIISTYFHFWFNCRSGGSARPQGVALFFCALVQSLRAQHKQPQLG